MYLTTYNHVTSVGDPDDEVSAVSDKILRKI